jgi:hypothetical protein
MTSRDALAAWIGEQSKLIRDDQLYASAPLDRLLGDRYTPPWDVDGALERFARVLQFPESRDRRLMIALVIPLMSSPTLDIAPRLIGDLDLDDLQPPTLYIFERAFFGIQFNDFEEYRVPIAAPSLDVEGQLGCYYTCFRDPVARQNGWEYARAVWLQHFPDR